MVDRLLIVVPESEEQATREVLARLAASGWEDSIRLVVGPVRRTGQPARFESERILRLAEDFGAESLIVTKEIFCDSRPLDHYEGLDIRRPTVGVLRRKILQSELEVRSLAWNRILHTRVAHWDSRKNDPGHWLQQFEQLGCRWVGEGLLRQIDIVPPAELSAAFRVAPQVQLGAQLLFTFFRDDDHGSSSNRIGGVLAHLHGAVNDLVAVLQSAQPGTRVVVCEDALWTGTEMRELLGRLAAGGDLHSYASDKRILFRHCVVSDYGIWVARHFLECNKMRNVELWLGEKQRYVTVLDPNLDEQKIRAQWHLSPAELDLWLAGNVRPLAFQDSKLWLGQQEVAREVCAHLGEQLVDHYANEHNKGWSDSVRRSFAIGAGRFGCTMGFPHSIPKVCLPLLWLGGRVTMRSKSIDWQPLFFDARRALQR